MAKYFYLEWESQTDEEIKTSPEKGELIEFESGSDIERLPSCVAEDAAKDRFDDAGSDLADPMVWPRKFHLYNSDKQYVGLFSVEMEYSPDFYAHKMTE